MKRIFLNAVLPFLLLMGIEVALTFLFFRLPSLKSDELLTVQLALIFSHIIIVVLLFKIWKVKTSNLFKKVQFLKFGLFFLVSIILVLSFPFLDAWNFFMNTKQGMIGVSMPSFPEEKNIFHITTLASLFFFHLQKKFYIEDYYLKSFENIILLF